MPTYPEATKLYDDIWMVRLSENDSPVEIGLRPGLSRQDAIQEVITMRTTPDHETMVRIGQQAIKTNLSIEEDRRLSAGFDFMGYRFQSDPRSREKIMGSCIGALASIVGGAQPRDLRWHGGDSDFTWTDEYNTEVPMDAQTVIQFGFALLAHYNSIHRAAKTLKNTSGGIPSDFTEDHYWP